LVFRDRPRSPAAEAYRNLRTALHFLPEDRQGPFVVTSCQPGEGRTACVANLGVALASAGRRVLLVDADLRRPRLAQFFGLTPGGGLGALLASTDAAEGPLATGLAGLEVLPAGEIPPNPAELLDGPALQRCLTTWQSTYDHVLFDSPPLAGLTDTVVLARRVRRALLVVRAMRTTEQDVAAATKRLRQAGVDVVGAVLVGHRSPNAALGDDMPGAQDGDLL
jgi:capsular exopolysaccharide synthesis family protein